MNDHDKSQDAAQQSEYARELAQLLNLLEAVDRQITPEHVAQRFHELLDEIGDDGPPVPRALVDRMVAMRDPNNPEGPVLTYKPAEWRAFMQRAPQGEFDDLGDLGVAIESFLESARAPSASASSSAEPAFFLRAALREAASGDYAVEEVDSPTHSQQDHTQIRPPGGNPIPEQCSHPAARHGGTPRMVVPDRAVNRLCFPPPPRSYIGRACR